MAPGVSEASSRGQEDAERKRGARVFFVSCDGGHNSSSRELLPGAHETRKAARAY
jgi:hypothetical protein